ncbi:MAG: hypothetical protein R6V48_05415 [Fidelibacterota bacterium]
MKYLHQHKTVRKAREFCEYLNNREYRALLDIDGTRDYLAKIDVYTAGLYIGKANIYYSPKKNSYKLTCQSITYPSYREVLQDHWRHFTGTDNHSAAGDGLCAYVDGSFQNDSIGYGAVIVQNNKILHEISGCLNTGFNSHRQIAGELKAVLETAKWCNKNNISEIHVFYDYTGIEMWAAGKWKAKNTLTKAYQEYMIRQSTVFHFHKVAAHSGDRWNDYADKLAKNGTKLNKNNDQ